VARAIHRLSRGRGPFEERSGSELTAEGLRAFLAGGSGGGTLYLSDVHALDREAQDVLWEWLTRHAGRRRLLVGTDRDLAERAGAGVFRADLLARLAVNTLRLPPLRDRLGELPEIAARLLGEAGGPGRALSPEALERLQRYPFPGNLDELAHALSHASLMATGPTVRVEDLPDKISGGGQ
jgi:two-component system response regulator PilR (NtrC family)